MNRGSFGFEVTQGGELVDCAANVQLLRKLWLDRSMIDGDDLGDGDPGDFDHGAWHIACHLVAAAGVFRDRDGRLLWAEISHRGTSDDYCAMVSVDANGSVESWPLASAEGRTLLQDATVLGFVEGNSLGRISAREVHDPPTSFNLWRRQDFDQPLESTLDGGKVWEHWCTTRDIRSSSRIGTSVLTGYVCLVAALEDLFPAAVARGRSDYAHPAQLGAMIRAGLTSASAAFTDLSPSEVPPACEKLLLEARPTLSLQAVQLLDWSVPPRYYMFSRRIDRWCPSAAIRNERKRFGFG